ncbi:hypothetical protein ACI0FM_08680 [Paenochrobactrum sp. BZR 588]|uniref:hypothetical protein n=1 Tax=unclassified Paenochrobactrum TaxID=2639760 RepID=UPI003851E66C
MAISYPYDLLKNMPGWSTEFELFYRQEMSRTAGGVMIVKNLGSPLWKATFQIRILSINALDQWRARLNTLDGGLNEFWGYASSRCYPIAYPNGVGMGSYAGAKLAEIDANRKIIRIGSLPSGFKISIGDHIQIGTRNLHQVIDVAGSQLEIRPHLWPESKVNDPVTLVRPSCKMVMVPGSLTSTADPATGRGSITFQAIESR